MSAGSAYASAVLCTSQTAHLFTITGKTLAFHDIGLFNTYGGTPSAGSAIQRRSPTAVVMQGE